MKLKVLLFTSFQIFCRNIFLSHWPMRGLLQSIPNHLRTSLLPILRECSSDDVGHVDSANKRSQILLNKMYEILSSELSGKTLV